VIFIFATTEPQKIPATIHSRCQRYGFKRVALHEIVERLRTIAAAEGIIISDSGLAMIARAAEGSMRDSQSLLDQAVSYSGMDIKDEDLQATLGSVAQATLLQFAAGLLAKDAAGLLRHIDALLEQGQDMRQFLAGAVEHVRNLLVVKVATDPTQIIELSAADIEAIKQQAAGADAARLLMLFDSLSKTLDDLRWSPHQRFTLEIGLIKACSLAELQPLSEVLGHLKELEAGLARGRSVHAASPSAAHRVSERSAPYTTPVPNVSAPSSGPDVAAGGGEHSDLWGSIISTLKLKKPGLASALGHGRITSVSDSELVIGIAGTRFQFDLVEKRENRMLIEEVAAGILRKKVSVKVQPLAEAPKQDAKMKSGKKKNPEDQDPAVQDVLRVFPTGEVMEPDNPSE
jgi:DNA polymerase-3 subunit gamma/tau